MSRPSRHGAALPTLPSRVDRRSLRQHPNRTTCKPTMPAAGSEAGGRMAGTQRSLQRAGHACYQLPAAEWEMCFTQHRDVVAHVEFVLGERPGGQTVVDLSVVVGVLHARQRHEA
jgi:hypothetical protein